MASTFGISSLQGPHQLAQKSISTYFPLKSAISEKFTHSKEDVAGFMKAKKYSYPVLMSDGNTHRNFKIRNYPTKLLLLPNGIYLDITFSEDYQVVLDKYLGWDLN